MRRTDQSGDTLQADGYLPQRALQVAWRLFDGTDDGSRQGAIAHQWAPGWATKEQTRVIDVEKNQHSRGLPALGESPHEP